MRIEEINKINNDDFIQISEIILKSNSNTMVAKLGKQFLIKSFLKVCVISNKLKLIILKENDQIISYCILAKKQKYLNIELGKFKFKILKKIIFSLSLYQLVNVINIFLNRDLFLQNKEMNEQVLNSANITYLAVKEKYRNKKIGRGFLETICKKYIETEFVTVETDNKLTLNFYTKYMNFQIIGYRKRLPKKLYLLAKKTSKKNPQLLFQ